MKSIQNITYKQPGWRCDQCILGFENTDFAAFCIRCNTIRPFFMYPYPVDKDQSIKLDRPDRLQISNPKPTTSKRSVINLKKVF